MTLTASGKEGLLIFPGSPSLWSRELSLLFITSGLSVSDFEICDSGIRRFLSKTIF